MQATDCCMVDADLHICIASNPIALTVQMQGPLRAILLMNRQQG
tara:strand:- start:87 stop:218 length:132 start_codon:yes stop_codon:yes gene_type:complete